MTPRPLGELWLNYVAQVHPELAQASMLAEVLRKAFAAGAIVGAGEMARVAQQQGVEATGPWLATVFVQAEELATLTPLITTSTGDNHAASNN